MILELPSLQENDKDFGNCICDINFLPSNSYEVALPGKSDSTTIMRTISAQIKCKLFKVSDLYDPAVEELQSLLDDENFPYSDFHREDVLLVLRSLGLQTMLNWPNIISCAKAIEKFQDWISESIKNSSAQRDIDEIKIQIVKLRNRSRQLLGFLDKNILDLLGENPQYKNISKPAKFGFRLMSFFSTKFLSSDDENSKIRKFVDELMSIAWIPIFHLNDIRENERFKNSYFGLPWLNALEDQDVCYFATPLQTRPESDIWYCSASSYVALFNLKTPRLRELFGWDNELDLYILACQLKEISKEYLRIFSCASEESKLLLRQAISRVMPQFYKRFNDILPTEKQKLTDILKGKYIKLQIHLIASQ